MIFRVVIFSVLVFLSHSALADWSKDFEIFYLMGDGDNRTSARQIALEQLKLKANSEAGTYVQGTTTLLKNGELTEHIELLSASLIKVSNLVDKVKVNDNGQAVLWVKANISIDEKELARRIEALRVDKEKAKQIKLLQEENDALYLALNKIRDSFKANLDSQESAELILKQNNTIRRIKTNSETVTQVFTSGLLIKLAVQNTDALLRAKVDLDENFITPILKSPVTAVIVGVEEDGKGGYTALVKVGWDVDWKKLAPILSPYLKIVDRTDSYDIAIKSYDNTKGRGPYMLSDNVYKYLGSKGIDLHLKLAGKEVVLPVLYSGSAFSDICGYYDVKRENKIDYICLVSQQSNSPIHGFDSKLYNPIRISMTKKEAESANQVEAVFRLTK